MANIFITGASSYLGICLIEFLKNENIFALKNVNEFPQFENVIPINKKEIDNLTYFFKKNNINKVIHLAGASKLNSKISKKQYLETNVYFGNQILESAIKSEVQMLISSGSYFQDIFPKEIHPYIVISINLGQR